MRSLLPSVSTTTIGAKAAGAVLPISPRLRAHIFGDGASSARPWRDTQWAQLAGVVSRYPGGCCSLGQVSRRMESGTG